MLSNPNMNRILRATEIGQINVVRLLIAEGYDVNEFSVSGNCPLLEAASRNDTKIVELLLEHGANPNVSLGGKTPLDWSQENQNELMERMITQKLNQTNSPNR